MPILKFQNQRCSAAVAESIIEDTKSSQNKEANSHATEQNTQLTPHALCKTITNIAPGREYPRPKKRTIVPALVS